MDGQEAYDEIVKRGGPDAFDVILMDLHMPRKVRRPPLSHPDQMIYIDLVNQLQKSSAVLLLGPGSIFPLLSRRETCSQDANCVTLESFTGPAHRAN